MSGIKKPDGKTLAFLLRHDTSYKFDVHGWRSVKDLIDNQGFSLGSLEEIIRKDEKGRYEFNSDHTMVRAVQGHSIPYIQPDLVEKEPPEYLYHGTSSRFIGSIMKEGLKPMSRQFVHLSMDPETAINVGKRHGGKVVVLRIPAKEMYEGGHVFYQAKNGVWLTNKIETSWIENYRLS